MPTFSDPGVGGDKLALADINGHAVIVKPLAHEHGIVTSFGERDAIRCHVADLTTGTFHADVLLFAGGVIGALKTRIGELVLAQVAQGTAKPGQSAPWMLAGMSGNPQVVQAAEAWLAANPGLLDTSFSAPATPAAPAAPVLAPQPVI